MYIIIMVISQVVAPDGYVFDTPVSHSVLVNVNICHLSQCLEVGNAIVSIKK